MVVDSNPRTTTETPQNNSSTNHVSEGKERREKGGIHSHSATTKRRDMGLLDGLFDKNKKGGNEGGIPNPFANRGGRSFHGQGQSLGGSKPGTVIPISLARPGPLGVRVEKRPNSEGTAIVNEVVPGSQAEEAGMKRGDILCFAGSDGQEEMMYDMFLELAKSPQRPLGKSNP